MIKSLSTELSEISTRLGISSDDFEGYLQDERVYLLGLQLEPPEETVRFQYFEALQDLEKSRCVHFL